MPAAGTRRSSAASRAAEPLHLIDRPSPNHTARRGGVAADMVVLHYTEMADAEAALQRLCDPAAEVSCHYLIGRCGRVWRLVDETQRAWHAGAGTWGAVTDVNSRSIGIELDNDGASPFGEPLMSSLEGLLADILSRHTIPPERVIAHSDMAPSRKADPGPRFDWRRLAIQGLSVWPTAAEDGCGIACARKSSPAERAFRYAATAFGYAAELPPDLRLSAFRLRFRPWASGPLAEEDIVLLSDLARRFPVDRAAVPA